MSASRKTEMEPPAAPKIKIGLAEYYNLVQGRRGFNLAPHHYPLVAGLEDKRIQNLLALVSAGAGKALAPEMPVLTPGGWVPIDFVRPGSKVIHPSGAVVDVVARVDVPESFMWNLFFAGNRMVTCHEDHLWKATSHVYGTAGWEGWNWTTEKTKNIVDSLDDKDWFVPLYGSGADTLVRLEHAQPEATERRSVCIQVAAPDGLYVTTDGVVTHNSNLFDIVYPTWELGHDPTLAILSVSAGERLPQTFLQASMQIIKDDPTFKKYFPDVRPDAGVGWSLERGLYVTGRHRGDENPSYFCAGLGSKALTGLHTRLMILDDLHDEENSNTPESRAVVVGKYYRTLMSRADPRGCRRVAVGRWWAEDDLYQEWRKSGDWVVMELPATRRGGSRRLWFDVYVPMDPETGRVLQCVFSETGELSPPEEQNNSLYVKYRVYYAAIDKTGMGFYWPDSKLQRRNYLTVKRRQPRTAAVNYDGDMSGGGEGVFKEEDFRPYIPPEDLSLGIQAPNVRGWTDSMKGVIEEAWDTALGQPQSLSLTAALTALFVPCNQWHRGEDPEIVGKCDFHYDVYLLDLMVRHLNFQELAMALRSRFGVWHPRRVIVEEKQSGVGLLSTFKGTHIPIFGQMVQQGKVERAINPILTGDGGLPIPGGAASVQGWVKMGRVLVPEGAEWLRNPHGDALQGFMQKICGFSGGVKASDEFDVLVHIVTRAIALSRQVAYVPGLPASAGVPDGLGGIGEGDPRMDVMVAFQTAAQAGAAVERGDTSDLTDSPFQGMCGAPCHWYGVFDNAERCKHPGHTKITHALSGCGDWAAHGTVKTSSN